MPSLTTVTLYKRYAFRKKNTIHTKSSSSSSLSFLDITPALSDYLSFPLFSYTTSICVNYNHHPSITRFHSMNTLTVHSITITIIIALFLSHSSQLHITISSTSSCISKLLNNTTDNNTNKNTSLTSESPFSLLLP